MRHRIFFALVVAAAACSLNGRAATITIGFEGVPDSTPAGSLYAAQGLTFSSGIIVTSGAFGGSLNEVDFPPLPPGQSVFLNAANTTTLTFSSPILAFSGFFTYGGPLTINFYGAGNSLLTTRTSAFLTNIGTAGSPGSSPNEALSATALANAVRVDILAPNTDFTLDNLTFTTNGTGPGPVPEPSTGVGAGAAISLLLFARRYRLRANP